MPTHNVFHLGKKAYIIPVSEDKEVILFGSTEWNGDDETCQLTMHAKVVAPGTEISLENIPARSRPLFTYSARSRRFKSGDFSEFDARRYIKSRYRDFTRKLFRQQEPEAKLTILSHRSNQFHLEQIQDETVTANETAATETEAAPVEA